MLKYNPALETRGFRLDMHDFYAVSAVFMNKFALQRQDSLALGQAHGMYPSYGVI